jgi:hypothetical protein
MTHAALSKSTPVQVSASAENGEIVVRFRVDTAPEDAIVALGATGLELKAAKALVRQGKLKAIKVGRKLFVRRSSLVALVDVLPAWAPPVEADDLAGAVARAARRRAA